MTEYRICLSHIGGISATIEKLSEMVATAIKEKEGRACLELIKERITASLYGYASINKIQLGREGKISCNMVYSPDADVDILYLEIEPELIWVYPDFEVSNNVYSNTEWVIN